jgi:hypothetical protein
MDPRDLVESEFSTEVVDPKMSYVASEDASKVEQKTEKKTAKVAKKATVPVGSVVSDDAPLQIESMTPSTGFTKPTVKLAVKEVPSKEKDTPREKDIVLEDGVIKYPEATDHKVEKMKLRIRLILQKMTTFNMLMKEQQQLFSTMLVDMDNISYDLKNL